MTTAQYEQPCIIRIEPDYVSVTIPMSRVMAWDINGQLDHILVDFALSQLPPHIKEDINDRDTDTHIRVQDGKYDIKDARVTVTISILE